MQPIRGLLFNTFDDDNVLLWWISLNEMKKKRFILVFHIKFHWIVLTRKNERKSWYVIEHVHFIIYFLLRVYKFKSLGIIIMVQCEELFLIDFIVYK